jgi:hypothetical protein
MSDCNPTKIPCSGKLDEIMTSLQQVPAVPNPALLKEYKELVGSLLFLQTGTVPEICWIVSVLARYMTKAGEPHMAAAKKVLRYLQSRKKIPLKWCAIDNALPGVIHGYADASFADIPDTRLSSIGYVFLVNGGAISWRSTKTPLQCLTQPRLRSSVSAQQHRNASFFANYASKWASTSTVRRSSTKTAKLLSLSLKRHASESAQNTLPFAGTL